MHYITLHYITLHYITLRYLILVSSNKNAYCLCINVYFILSFLEFHRQCIYKMFNSFFEDCRINTMIRGQ